MTANQIGATVVQLEAMLQKDERQVEALQQRIQAIRSALEVLAPHNHPGIEQAVQQRFKQRVHKNSMAHLVRTATSQILLENGRPMSRSDILAKLQERGVKINSDEPEKRLSKILWDAGEFHNDGSGYWFAHVTGFNPISETTDQAG